MVGLVDKILRISDPQFYQENLDFLIQILLNIEYPLILSTIISRLKELTLLNKNVEDETKHSL